MKILIADDEESIPTIMKNFLIAKGYKDVDLFFRGAEAIEAVKINKYDIPFLDAKMPNVSGSQIARYIKENGLKTNVVMITGSVQKDLPGGIVEFADEYLVKPFHLKAAEDIIERYSRL